MTWTLTWKGNDGPRPVDGRAFRADTLGQLSGDALRAKTIPIGRADVRLDELFDIEGEPSETLCLRDLPLLDHLGAGMTTGTFVIDGDVGHDLGASMSGGLIVVKGNAGDRVGGPDFGKPSGMTGGEIIVDGNAGDHVGHLMRRGLIAINGQCGKSPGFRMLAGTIVVGSGPLDYPGLEMQRGTVICMKTDNDDDSDDGDADPYEHLAYAGEYTSGTAVSINIVLQRVATLAKQFALSDAPHTTNGFKLWHGDRFELNKGEIIQCLS